jgi:glycosyltransferase involved in cell wall biosynthesis
MKEVVESEPEACLILVGNQANETQVARVKERIQQHRLQNHIFLLGSRSDVPSVLCGCDIGVLSSASEGMPLALLEYGMAGLPTVATRVGQVPEILDEGRAGLLVSPGQPVEIARDLLTLLNSTEVRQTLGQSLNRRVREKWSQPAIMDQLISIYEKVLNDDVQAVYP